jgi:hypothetical protein
MIHPHPRKRKRELKGEPFSPGDPAVGVGLGPWLAPSSTLGLEGPLGNVSPGRR